MSKPNLPHNATHTPGPWKAEKSTWPRIGIKGCWWQIWTTGQGDADFVADIGRTDNATDEDVARDAATAHLIAAAPELLEACELAADEGCNMSEGYRISRSTLEKLVGAIGKARGIEPTEEPPLTREEQAQEAFTRGF